MPNPASDTAGSRKAGERLPAVWPWLLIPLVALALFFALRGVRADSDPAGTGGTPAAASPSEDSPQANVR